MHISTVLGVRISTKNVRIFCIGCLSYHSALASLLQKLRLHCPTLSLADREGKICALYKRVEELRQIQLDLQMENENTSHAYNQVAFESEQLQARITSLVEVVQSVWKTVCRLRKKESLPMPKRLAGALRACITTLAAENATKDEEGTSASRQEAKEEETPVINE